MQITKISEQIKDKNRANIYIDGKYSFSLTLGQLLDSHLKVGVEIDKKQLNRLKNISQEGKLKARTIEWLMIRPRSSNELQDYLKRKKLGPTAIEFMIREMQAKDYQNDDNFTRWWIEQRVNKNYSTRSIRYELRAKGIQNDTIDKFLQNKDKETLKTLIVKKRKLKKYQDNNKLIEYLLRQGFNYSDVKVLLAE
jgi:regulatory protein